MIIIQDRYGVLMIVKVFDSFPKNLGTGWVKLLKKLELGFSPLLFVPV